MIFRVIFPFSRLFEKGFRPAKEKSMGAKQTLNAAGADQPVSVRDSDVRGKI
jgi:hypothetical protein